MKIIIRKAKLEDVSQIVEVEKKSWPEGLEATKAMFKSRIRVFAEGNLVAVVDNKIIGIVSAEIINYDINKHIPSWYELTDNGYIKKSHNLKGNTLFGVDLSVIPEFRNKGIAKLLIQEIGKLTIRYNLQYSILGARIPDYHKYCKKMSPKKYINLKRKDGQLVDPELRLYRKYELHIKGILPNYFNDPESCNYGVLLVRENPFYIKNK